MRTNLVHQAILHASWQEEQDDRHAARPWLRWFLTRVVEMKGVLDREPDTKKGPGRSFARK